MPANLGICQKGYISQRCRLAAGRKCWGFRWGDFVGADLRVCPFCNATPHIGQWCVHIVWTPIHRILGLTGLLNMMLENRGSEENAPQPKPRAPKGLAGW